MAVSAEAVRKIVREELAEVRAELKRLAAAVDAAADEGRERVLSVEDAAAYLGGLPVTTLKSLVAKRGIGFVKIGRSTVFPVAELDAYIEAHTAKPVENPWGLTDEALADLRQGRSRR